MTNQDRQEEINKRAHRIETKLRARKRKENNRQVKSLRKRKEKQDEKHKS